MVGTYLATRDHTASVPCGASPEAKGTNHMIIVWIVLAVITAIGVPVGIYLSYQFNKIAHD